jgi:hypothetical protein
VSVSRPLLFNFFLTIFLTNFFLSNFVLTYLF